MPQLDGNSLFLSQIFWLFVSFGLIYFMVAKAFGPKVSDVIENRSNVISSNINTAEKLKNEAASIQKEYYDLISGVKEKSNEIKNAAVKSASTATALGQSKVDAEMQTKITQAEQEIIQSKNTVMNELEQNFITEFVQQITSEISGVDISKDKITAAIKNI